ncbi:hypothetical protein, partial [Streptomyces djakartensis]|uniref:hypothetical protein n=1 Tax=Streptomyces djakartensis TaxID=68193 RepID=UPI0034DEB5E6
GEGAQLRHDHGLAGGGAGVAESGHGQVAYEFVQGAVFGAVVLDAGASRAAPGRTGPQAGRAGGRAGRGAFRG